MADLQRNRLESGGRIDRSKPLSFKFNGKKYQGFEGDTIASALLANGIGTVNRSFKYHRPRGVMSAGVEETNALLTVSDGSDEVPVVRTTVRALIDNHKIKSGSGFPSVNFDLGRVLDFTHRIWTAGFYNKVFKWPNWHWYEGVVRRMAGLGKLPGGDDRNKYFHHNLHCDVLIVGAGPAGLAAACRRSPRRPPPPGLAPRPGRRRATLPAPCAALRSIQADAVPARAGSGRWRRARGLAMQARPPWSCRRSR